MMLTSADRQNDAARCRSLRMAGYLVKPVKADELQIAIIAALSGALKDKQSRPTETQSTSHSTVLAARRSLRILVAEDNPVNQRVALHILEKAGHSAVAVSNGKEAIGALAREKFDLVLMDVQMPELDGLEATRAIRDHEKRTSGHIPIVAMTAHAMKGDRERCLEAGMDNYVAKPVQASELLRVIESIAASKVAESQPSKKNDFGEGRVFDLQAAMNRIDGDEDFLVEVIRLFVAEVPSHIQDIRSAVEERNAKRLECAAHSLKGSASSLGGLATAAAALKLEGMGKTSDFSEAGDGLAELQRELDRLTAAISEFLLERTAAPA
jgi:CheY-like chemotaxis protein/HPt (histidine-containing phosphotransfer) domain-containing protein